MKSNSLKFVLFALLLVLAYAGYAWMIRPASARLDQKREQINIKLEKLNELSRASSQAQDLSRQLSDLSDAIIFFQSRLPHESQIHKVLEQITLVAQKNGLKPGTISALKTSDCNGYIEQPLKMQFQGDFYSFYSFVEEVEKLPRIIRLRQFDLKKNKENPSFIDVDFVISIFFST